MTLKDIRLKPSYISLRDDVAEEFYIPVMKCCSRFDRISCYFTIDALVRYCTGLYYLGRNGGKYRLIISKNVSETTFNTIKDGYDGSLLLDDIVKEQMRENLSLDDTATLSNLSYLMRCGLVEIKFAICHNGLFHEKTGYVEDGEGNSLSFTGSNNETRESMDSNYEKFDITASWLSSEFDKLKITEAKEEFDSMWNGTNPHVKVFDPPQSFDRYMESFDEGHLIEPSDLCTDSFILDYRDGSVVLRLPEGTTNPSGYKFKLAIYSKVESVSGCELVLKNLSKSEVYSVIERVERYSKSAGTATYQTKQFQSYLESHRAMEKLADLGRSIKSNRPEHADSIKLFASTISKVMVRTLRKEQVRDAYYAYRMGRSANFSVPGSGKTATALGTFAYLMRTQGFKRIVVIGPLNCFDSWRGEFSKVFGANVPLRSIDITEIRAMGGSVQQHVRFDLGGYNLILLNYEAFDRTPNLADAVRDRIDSKTLLVFDEVHRIKAVDGKRAAAVMPVATGCSNIIVMTGTPIPNDYSDVYNFLHILYGSADYNDYFKTGPAALSKLSGQDALDFNDLLRPFFIRTTKAKLGVPPPNRDNMVMVDASEDEQSLFDRLRTTRMNPLARIVRILQLESDPSIMVDTLDETEAASFGLEMDECLPGISVDPLPDGYITEKTRSCVELVEGLVKSGKSVIVWCIFIRSIENLSDQLAQRGIDACCIHGGTENRGEIIDDFREGLHRVLITNPQTLAESVSLHQVCHDAVYFEYSYNLIHLLQSKDRIHRLGLAKDQTTQYHFMETAFRGKNNSISLDAEIYSRLVHKQEVMMEAIENDSLERFMTDSGEAEAIVASLGLDVPDGQQSK